jgi:8-oxo-dGTP pyrophosphatase MutT (NUDIX family)
MAKKNQCAALPFRKKNGKLEIILITRKGNGEWIIPKGNIETDRSESRSAELEAFEEAGVTGSAGKTSVGKFKYHRNNQDQVVYVYPIEVKKVLRYWPEKKERKRKIVSFKKALDLVGNESLRKLLKTFRKEL